MHFFHVRKKCFLGFTNLKKRKKPKKPRETHKQHSSFSVKIKKSHPCQFIFLTANFHLKKTNNKYFVETQTHKL
mgnify:CR=1 FL=1